MFKQIRKIGQSIRKNLINENELNFFNAYRNIYKGKFGSISKFF